MPERRGAAIRGIRSLPRSFTPVSLDRLHVGVMSSRKRLLLLTLGALSLLAPLVWQAARHYAMSMPSYRRARASVTQIVFLRGRILLRNELSDIFVSDDHGRSWRALSEKVPTLTVANGNELWAAHGWPGRHEEPSASIWRSADSGETWSNKDVEVAKARDAALGSVLPATIRSLHLRGLRRPHFPIQ